MKTSFLPIEQLVNRANNAIDDSDVAYFYDLIALGEMVTKLIALFLVANIEDDVDRTRYRYEYQLIRADGIGTFAEVIGQLLTGSAADLISSSLRDREVAEMTQKCKDTVWQKKCLEEINVCLDDLDLQHNQMTHKSSLIIWFTNFSILRNKTKGHGTITNQQCGKINNHLASSLSLIIENSSIFNRPWAFLHQNLSGKYKISPLNSIGDTFDFLKRNNSSKYADGIYCYTDKPHHITMFFSDSELSFFNIVNGNFSEKGTYECLNYLTNTKSTYSGEDYMLPPTKLPDSQTSGKSILDIQGSSFTNLPLGLTDYIQRSELEKELTDVLLEEERYPIATLKGRGGIGKTSLAIQVISNILTQYSERFDVVVWFSARDVDLFIDGPKAVQAVVASQKDIANEYFNQIGKADVPSKKMTEMFAQELSHNTLGKTLYVFDNFETLTNPLEVYEWLNSYIRLPNKILITSRLSRNFKADYPLEVRGMTDAQCEELIHNTASKFNILEILNRGYITKLIEESDGHPYIIKIILGEVAKAGRLQEIKRVVADKDKVLDALFKRTYSTISLAAKRVFLTLCSWHSVIPQIALESVILRAENEKIDLDAAVEELDKSSFIEINERDDDVFISVPLAARIYGVKELEVSPDKASILKDKQLLMEFGAGTKRGKATLEAHIEKKVSAVANRVKNLDQFEEEIPSLECLSSRYPLIWEKIAKIYHSYGAFSKEKEAYRELLKVLSSTEQKIVYWKQLASICNEDNDWNGESAALAEIVSSSDVAYEDVSYSAYRINKYYSNCIEPDTEEKNYLIEKVISVMEMRIKEANAVDCSRLAWLFLNRQDEAKALRYAQKGIQLDSQNQHCKKLIEKLSGTIR